MYTIHFETLGCKLNQIETESAASSFADAGFAVTLEPVSAERSSVSPETPPALSEERSVSSQARFALRGTLSPDYPFLSIVNTCTVTGKAEQKARRLIRLLLSLWPASPVLVTGCYAEVDASGIRAIDPRVFVVPGKSKDNLTQLPGYLMERIERRIGEGHSVSGADAVGFVGSWVADSVSGVLKSSPRFSLATDDFRVHSRASIKIQDGCGNRCAFCRICLARGASVSLPAAEVVSRVQQIERAGWREVVLTGVNLSQYRGVRDGESPADFPELLRLLLSVTTRVSFRISSLYPDLVDERLCGVLRDPRVRPHFHLSVQSLSDSVLTAMRRPYRAAAVRRAVELLRGAKDNPFIAADIIAGFPGETAEDFAATLSGCADLRFAWIHAFPFSPRPGTEAWSMKPKVPERIAGERVAALTRLAHEGKNAYLGAWQGKTLPAILERGKNGQIHAVTENYLRLRVEGVPSDLRPGQELLVTVLPLVPDIDSAIETQADGAIRGRGEFADRND